MKKFTAVSILTTIFLGLSAFAGKVVFENAKDIAGMKIFEQSLHEDVREIKADVKKLLERR
jgi:hypothetical protein